MQGTITRVVADRGFGFIAPHDRGEDFFFHLRDLRGGLIFSAQLVALDVEFTPEETDRGPRAVNIRPLTRA